jgi:undecaprenyl-diphosphatase
MIYAVILGIVQGLTEFLPVSSSGHLAIIQQLMPGFSQPGVLLDVMLHLGTLAAVIVFFRHDLINLARSIISIASPRLASDTDPADRRLILALFLAQIPTGIIGVILEDRVERSFSSITVVGACFIVTAILITAAELIARRRPERAGNPSYLTALVIGLFQGLAVFPGLSRSGSTISAGRALGMAGPDAARFSFLCSLPAILGAALVSSLKHRREIMAFSTTEIAAYLAGPLAAAIVGYFAIGLLLRIMRSRRLIWFAPYCAAAGIAAIVLAHLYGK